MRIFKYFRKVAALGFALLIFPTMAWADEQAVREFYEGREITIHIGGSIGGTYGAYATVLARHMGKHIPGNPTIIVVPLDGAGGTRNLNYMADAAPKDGSVLSLPSWELIVFEIFGHEAARFDATAYNWIGRLSDVSTVLITSGQSGINSLEDAIDQPLVTGSQGPRDHFAISPTLINHLVGTNFRVVQGYVGASGILLAMDQGEVDGMAVTWTNVDALWVDQLEAGDIVPIVSITHERYPGFPEIPALGEFIADPIDQAFFDIWLSQSVVGRSVIAPEGVPQDRIDALRFAFDATMADPEFIREMEERNFVLAPLQGEEIEARVHELLAMPEESIEMARDLYFGFVRSVEGS